MSGRRRLSRFALAIAGLGPVIAACDGGPSQVTFALTGTVTEMTSAGVAPVRGLLVINPRLGRTSTDSWGRYRFWGVPPGPTTIAIDVGPFETVARTVEVNADVVVDFQLVRRPRYTLSGFVTEDTPAGPVPIAGVDVDVELCPPQMNGGYALVSSQTDMQGFYSVPDMCDGRAQVFALKPGYTYATAVDACDDGHGTECRWATIAGDTRFDLRLTRR